MYDIIIIGGGLAGLINAIQLSKAGLSVCLVEKKQYPFHKVCGEYISKEVEPFLKAIDAYPNFADIAHINKLILCDTHGREIQLKLPLGGFGISRYLLDDFFYKKALENGTTFLLGKQAAEVEFTEDAFKVTLSDGSILTSRLVIGAYGKRSKIDKSLNRGFILRRSPYIGVKYHIRHQFPNETIALYNFKKGYCGVSKIEEGKFNLCYLSHRDNLKDTGDVKAMEETILCKNPKLKRIFEEAEFLNEKPLVINEISFEAKKAVENHILMSGDAAGMITPLCGNGMAMAIHSAKILSDHIINYFKSGSLNRAALESGYTKEWEYNFKRRLQTGRVVQRFFGHSAASSFTVALAKSSATIARFIISQTHGRPF